MGRELYVAVDLGTTAVKAGLFDADGHVLATASREIRLDTPAPGFVEFDADAYIGTAFDVMREVAAAGHAREAVRAVGISSQAQTFVLLGADGRPLRAAVSWLDVRAGREAEELSALAQQLGRGRVNAIGSAPKILWLRRHEPDVLARTARVLVIPDYLIYRLTGRAATDPITACSTEAYDVWTGRWTEEILAACGLDVGRMPDVLSAGEAAGRLTGEAAAALGLTDDVVVVVGTNDQYTGALGAGNVEPGCASMALGTALAIVATSASKEGAPPGVGVQPHPAAGPAGGLFAVLAYAKTSGVVIRWFRDQFAPGLSYDALFAEIARVPAGAEGLTCVPHLSGTATPDFDASVRGAFAGLSLAHTRSHLARSVAESLAFTVRDNLALLGRVVAIDELRAIGGGAKSDVWLQMIADVARVPVVRPETGEAACLGAAALAMVGSGRWPTAAEAARRLYRPARRFEPDSAVREAYDRAYGRYRSVFQSLYGRRSERI